MAKTLLVGVSVVTVLTLVYVFRCTEYPNHVWPAVAQAAAQLFAAGILGFVVKLAFDREQRTREQAKGAHDLRRETLRAIRLQNASLVEAYRHVRAYQTAKKYFELMGKLSTHEAALRDLLDDIITSLAFSEVDRDELKRDLFFMLHYMIRLMKEWELAQQAVAAMKSDHEKWECIRAREVVRDFLHHHSSEAKNAAIENRVGAHTTDEDRLLLEPTESHYLREYYSYRKDATRRLKSSLKSPPRGKWSLFQLPSNMGMKADAE